MSVRRIVADRFEISEFIQQGGMGAVYRGQDLQTRQPVAIKLLNVLLAEDGTPRLTDFGVAHIDSSDMTGSGVVVGTYAYLSPESLNGLILDTRADIWAFGVLLFEMLTGRSPFTADSPGAVM